MLDTLLDQVSVPVRDRWMILVTYQPAIKTAPFIFNWITRIFGPSSNLKYYSQTYCQGVNSWELKPPGAGPALPAAVPCPKKGVCVCEGVVGMRLWCRRAHHLLLFLLQPPILLHFLFLS